jgi:hypothetical protein
MSPCIRKKMTTPRADESLSLLSGSTVKDQTYARHLSNPNIRDIEVLLYCVQVILPVILFPHI